jgi:hypothetical protein
MKAMKRILCLALAMSVVLGMTGCKKSKFSQQAIRKYAEAEDYDEYDDNDEFYDAVGFFNEDQYSYITATKRDARDLFNTIIYRFEVDKPKYDFTEVTALIASDDDGFCLIVAATFEDVEEAEKFFKKFPKTVDMENEDKGEEKSYSYFISYDDSNYTRTVAYGLYLSGNTVIWLRTASDDCEVAEDFCKHFNLISPLDA